VLCAVLYAMSLSYGDCVTSYSIVAQCSLIYASEWPLVNGETQVRAVWEEGSGLAAESTALTRGPDFL
jgi:hypothetical protein